MFRVLKVSGDSLLPVFREGDFVFVTKIPFILRTLKKGDVIVFKHSQYGTLIKWIEEITPDRSEMTVIGDHPFSIDSRHFGPVGINQLVGKVIWHISQAKR